MNPEYSLSLRSPNASSASPFASPSSFAAYSTPLGRFAADSPLASFHTPSSIAQACSTPAAAASVHTPGTSCYLENCSVCLSPLTQENFVSQRGENFVTTCNHTFHRSCLSKLREFDTQDKCPMCRQQLPLGLTPPSVRAQREARAMLDTTNNHQNRNLIVSRAAAAREAVARRMRRDQVHEAMARQASEPPPLVIVGSQPVEVEEDEVVAAAEGMQVEVGSSSHGEGSGEAGGCCEACSHCESRGAEHKCEGCQSTFCSLCSTKDYSERLERSFCLDCQTSSG